MRVTNALFHLEDGLLHRNALCLQSCYENSTSGSGGRALLRATRGEGSSGGWELQLDNHIIGEMIILSGLL